MSATKSPLPGVADQQTYERLLGLGAADVYRQIPLAFDPAALPRGIHIDPGSQIKPEHVELLSEIFLDFHASYFVLIKAQMKRGSSEPGDDISAALCSVLLQRVSV